MLNDYDNIALAISSISITGDFAETNTCSTGLQGGSQCYIYITFSPTAIGARTGTLTITDNASSSPSPQKVSLSGLAIPAGNGATTAAIGVTGKAGSYTQAGTVVGTRAAGSPTGSVSFVDTSNGSFSLGSASLGSSTIALSLANGPSAATGINSSDLAVADFNGDGKPDIAVANDPGSIFGTGAGLTILLGNGDGTFTAAPGTVPASAIGGFVATGDFNHDGKADLVTSGTDSSSLTVLLGNGDGTFIVASNPTVTNIPLSVAVGDFNGDGKADLAVATVASDGSVAGMSILLGAGDGTFTSGPTLSPALTTQLLTGVLVADFNGDGKADLASLNYTNELNPTANEDGVTVWLGNGDGTFQSPLSASFGSQFGLTASVEKDIAAGDFNGDGKPDLVVEGFAENAQQTAAPDAFIVLTGNGDGTFSVGSPIAITSSPTYNGVTGDSNSGSVTVTDFNGDGKPDVVVLNDNVVQVLLNNGDGTFTAAASVDSGAETAPNWLALAVADFNGDGLPDFAALNSDSQLVTIALEQRAETATATLANVSVPGSGTHNIKAVYSGDSNFAASTSPTTAITAAPISTTLNLATSTSASSYGVQLALNATLAPYSDGSLSTASETVNFLSNGKSIGTAKLSSGVAALNVNTLPVGADNVTATYAGDNNFAAATSAAVSVTIGPAVPGATLSPSSLTFAAQNTGSTSAAQTITLTNSGQASLAINSIAASGDFAQTNTCGTSLAAGADCAIDVTFTPTATGARTGNLTINDNASGSPQTAALTGTGSDVSIAAPTTPLTVSAAGGSATATIQLSSAGGFSGTVNVACAVQYQGSGTPTDPPACSVSPAQERVSAGSPVTATLTVTTTAAGASARLRNWLFPVGGTGSAMAALLFFGSAPRQRRRWAALLALTCAILLGMATGCGGSNSNPGSRSSNAGTTTGSYNVILTATSGTASSTLTIPLSVQ